MELYTFSSWTPVIAVMHKSAAKVKEISSSFLGSVKAIIGGWFRFTQIKAEKIRHQ